MFELLKVVSAAEYTAWNLVGAYIAGLNTRKTNTAGLKCQVFQQLGGPSQHHCTKVPCRRLRFSLPLLAQCISYGLHQFSMSVLAQHILILHEAQTLSVIKKSPLLAGLYRKHAMPLNQCLNTPHLWHTYAYVPFKLYTMRNVQNGTQPLTVFNDTLINNTPDKTLQEKKWNNGPPVTNIYIHVYAHALRMDNVAMMQYGNKRPHPSHCKLSRCRENTCRLTSRKI